jgi:hypothetical protein
VERALRQTGECNDEGCALVPSDIQGLGVLEFAATAAHARAAHYRDQAARLREMAEAEPIGRLRERLIDTARQYEDLATNALMRRLKN